MARVKRGVTKLKHRHNVLKRVKGFRGDLKSKERAAHTAILHAGKHSFAHRKDKKADFRKMWTVRINAAVRPLGLSYSKLMDACKKKGLLLDRKVLATIAESRPESFVRIVKKVS